MIDSHHDLIVSSCELPTSNDEVPDTTENIVAPIVSNDRCRVVWSDEGIEQYQQLVLPELARIQNLYLSNPSPTLHALFLESTNNVLISSAAATNKTIPLKESPSQKSAKIPHLLKKSQRALLKQFRALKNSINSSKYSANEIESLKMNYTHSKNNHRKLVRSYKAKEAAERDANLYSIFSSNPSKLFNSIKRSKRSESSKIRMLTVGNKLYFDDSVKDGFFDSISSLKSVDQQALNDSEYFQKFSSEYSAILEICNDGPAIPTLTEKQSFDLLQRMKPNICDFNGLTVNHFIFAGPPGWKHFHLLLNSLIVNIKITSIKEINVVHAIVLFKGHKKNKNLDRSYRTISTCLVIAKALDLYARDLHKDLWKLDQAETQFQGEGSSHELVR